MGRIRDLVRRALGLRPTPRRMSVQEWRARREERLADDGRRWARQEAKAAKKARRRRTWESEWLKATLELRGGARFPDDEW